MTKEEVIQYFKVGDFSDVSREAILQCLFQSGRISFSDFIELQKFLEYSRMPILAIKEPIEWDTEKWLECSKSQRFEIVSKDNNQYIQ